MKIVFVFPCHKKYISDPSMNIVPLGLLSMARILESQGHKVTVIHLSRFTNKDAIRLIDSIEPELIGISVFTFNRVRAFDFADRVNDFYTGKENVPRLIVGGPHVPFLASEILSRFSYIDGVVCDEGEVVVPLVVERLSSGSSLSQVKGFYSRDDYTRQCTPVFLRPNERIADLDTLIPPVTDTFTLLGVEKLYQKRHYITSRGCSAKCRFCSAPSLWGSKVRSHSVSRVIEDVKALRDTYGLVHFSFRDDTFTADKEWTLEFCSQIEKLNVLWDCQSRVSAIDEELALRMRQAGCIQVQLGVESASDRILHYLKKPFSIEKAEKAIRAFRATGTAVSLYLICGVPDETRKELSLTADFVRKYRPANLSVSRLALYPGTDLAKDVEPSLWFENTDESIFVRSDKGAVKNEEFLQKLADELLSVEPYTVNELEGAVKMTGNSPVSLLALGQLYERIEDYDAALEVYEELVELYPDYFWGLMTLGDLCLDGGYIEEALKLLSRAIEIVPQWPYAMNRLGWAYKLSGDGKTGDRYIEKSIMAEPFADVPEPPLSV